MGRRVAGAAQCCRRDDGQVCAVGPGNVSRSSSNGPDRCQPGVAGGRRDYPAGKARSVRVYWLEDRQRAVRGTGPSRQATLSRTKDGWVPLDPGSHTGPAQLTGDRKLAMCSIRTVTTLAAVVLQNRAVCESQRSESNTP